MKFIDECLVKVQAGKGGNGLISFRREYRVDRGGPDGGDGGRGGSIYFVGDSGMNTLMPLKFKKNIFGVDGENGKRKNMYGAKGRDTFIKVPLGTLVFDGQRLLFDITEAKPYLVAQGGKGGKGNTRFKTAKNTAPKISENGDLGQKFNLKLELKVLADIGFVGKPSAGKSTLLAKITNAKPKIADYSFTTLTPQLGIVYLPHGASFVVADLPGLIKGASQGKGLGHEFLKHIERCRVIAHIIDFGQEDKNPIHDFEIINEELKNYSLNLETRAQVVIANKSDLPTFTKNINAFKKKYGMIDIIEISALQEDNLDFLKQKLNEILKISQPLVYKPKASEVTITLDDPIIIKNPFKGHFIISGPAVEKIYNKIPLSTWENFQRFNIQLKNIGVWDLLKSKGVKDGDTIEIFSYEFQWGQDKF